MSAPTDKTAQRPVMARMPPALIDQLRATAEAEDRTMAHVIRRAIKQYLAAASGTPQ